MQTFYDDDYFTFKPLAIQRDFSHFHTLNHEHDVPSYSDISSGSPSSEKSGYALYVNMSDIFPFFIPTTPTDESTDASSLVSTKRKLSTEVSFDINKAMKLNNHLSVNQVENSFIGLDGIDFHDETVSLLNGLEDEEKKYECTLCDKKYRNMNGLKYHLEKVHLPHESASLDDLLANAKKVTFNPNKPFACDVCGKRYKNANGMKYHIEHTHAGVDSTL